MEWLSLSLQLGTEYLKLRNKKLSVKYKEKFKSLEDDIWEEDNKDYSDRDMAKLDNLRREKAQLERLFYNEIKGALNETDS
jgi:hypothetical protein